MEDIFVNKQKKKEDKFISVKIDRKNYDKLKATGRSVNQAIRELLFLKHDTVKQQIENNTKRIEQLTNIIEKNINFNKIVR